MEPNQLDSVDRDAAAWLAELPGVDRQLETLRMRLLRIGRSLDWMLAGIAQHHGLSLGDWEALSVLRRSGRPYTMSPTSVARELQVTSGTMTIRLDRLESAGLVERMGSNRDRRSRPVRLTAAGGRRWRAATVERTSTESRLLSSGLTQKAIHELNDDLRRVMLSLESELGTRRRRVEPVQ